MIHIPIYYVSTLKLYYFWPRSFEFLDKIKWSLALKVSRKSFVYVLITACTYTVQCIHVPCIIIFSALWRNLYSLTHTCRARHIRGIMRFSGTLWRSFPLQISPRGELRIVSVIGLRTVLVNVLKFKNLYTTDNVHSNAVRCVCTYIRGRKFIPLQTHTHALHYAWAFDVYSIHA